MSSKRKSFSASFKTKVALEAIKEEYSINELASKYEVHPNMIRSWKKIFLENSESLFEDKRRKKQTDKEEIETDELYKRIGQLEIENNWMKKKLGF